MAYSSGWDHADADVDRRGGGPGGLLVTALWAAGSLGAFVAVVAWAYDLGSRNPADVPAIQQAAAAWRNAPADPGGWRAPGQDQTAYAPIGSAQSTLAPGAVVGAGPERPSEADVEAARRRAAQAAAAPVDARPEIDTTELQDVMREQAEVGDPMARRAAIDLDAQPPRGGEGLETSLAARPDFPKNEGDGAEPAPSNVVRNRPQGAAPAAANETAAAPAPTPEQPPEASPPAVVDGGQVAGLAGEGPSAAPAPRAPARPQTPAPEATNRDRPARTARVYQVQLGALDSEAAAQGRWRTLQARQASLLASERMEVQSVEIGGATLYRLRAGSFADRAEAKRLCDELRKSGVDCFPTAR